ncbi:MAG TPA: nicotinamidase [Acidobacteriota bacterium]|nr:nicotinamidase [Acidobacteriota bacterium]
MKKDFSIASTDALIIVDVQNDFCPGGALPVPEGDQVIPVLNDYIKIFKKANASIFATRDWHPPNHISFKAQGGPWPPHCIQNSEGAKFHPDLKLPSDTAIISKATDPLKESYSGFDGTELVNMLRTQDVVRVFVGGLASDYCVKNTVLDARKMGFETVLLLDAIRGINVEPGDVRKAIDEMIKNGAEQATLENFPEPLEAPPAEDPDTELLAKKPLARVETKKKARMRPRGRYKRVRTERG